VDAKFVPARLTQPLGASTLRMNAQHFTVNAPVTVESDYRERSCKRSWGHVTISASPSPTFSFTSVAFWPAANYSSAVERGLIEGLKDAGYESIFNAAVVLENVEWDDLDSTEHAFFVAARQAAEKILASGQVVTCE